MLPFPAFRELLSVLNLLLLWVFFSYPAQLERMGLGSSPEHCCYGFYYLYNMLTCHKDQVLTHQAECLLIKEVNEVYVGEKEPSEVSGTSLLRLRFRFCHIPAV